MARLWPLASAADSIDLGRPTLERNHLRKFTTQSTHSSDEIPSRSNIGCRFSGIAPRLPEQIWRPVQSNATANAAVPAQQT